MTDRRYDSGDSPGPDDSNTGPPVRDLSVSPGRGEMSRSSRPPPAGRVYVGNLPNNADKKLVEDLFAKFGEILEISVKRTISGSPFAFVEFGDGRDAQDAIQGIWTDGEPPPVPIWIIFWSVERDGYKIDGCVLRVEVPFAARSGPRGQNTRGRAGPPRRADFRVCVRGLPPSGSWQDLKDHMREAGDCVYADVFRDGTGVVEFARREDMDYAIRHFDNSKFRSHEGETSRITVTRMENEDFRYSRYDSRRSPDNRGGRYYRGRSPYDYHRDYRRDDYRGRSYSAPRYNRRSDTRTRSRSRSYRRHR